MLNCFVKQEDKNTQKPIPIAIVTQNDFPNWLKNQDVLTQKWVSEINFLAQPFFMCLIPGPDTTIARVVLIVKSKNYFWNVGGLPYTLPLGLYAFEEADQYESHAIAWGLGAYQFTRYKKPLRAPAQLFLSENINAKHVENCVDAIYLVRDLINTPTDDMGPEQLAIAAKKLAQAYKAEFKEIVGEDLLKQNYAAIYTVGRASDEAPRLLDIRWGNPKHPKITLVGKGVCFDTGGLDIKGAPYMLLMKKDMAGAAHVLGLARMIMQAELPVCLRVLIPAVENSISGNAYRPGDIIKSRKGLTIEIGNTDAEGRVILADALTEAAADNPALIIDMTTLTGAARVAVGTDIAAMFANDDELAQKVLKYAEEKGDPIWRLPLFAPYREYLNSNIADINNNASEPYAGAITAALFMKEFVPDHIPWLHFDMMAWNLRTYPGRPQGGEAMSLRALFAYLQDEYAS